jgi:hypothetical protein
MMQINIYIYQIKEVVKAIALYDPDNWLADENWEKILPYWFVSRVKDYSIEDIIQNPNLWHFGSWLDAMKYRGWKWFSSKVYSNEFIIILEPLEFPYSVNSLEFVIMESGINLGNIKFKSN